MPRPTQSGAGGTPDAALRWKAKRLYDRYVGRIRERDGGLRWYLKAKERRAIPAIAEVLRAPPELQAAFLSDCARRVAVLWPKFKAAEKREIERLRFRREPNPTLLDRTWAALEALCEFLPRRLPLSDADLLTLARLGAWGVFADKRCDQRAAAVFERAARHRPLPAPVLRELRTWSRDKRWRYTSDPRRQLTALLASFSPAPVRTPPARPRLVASAERAGALLRANAPRVKHAFLSGQPLRLREQVPADVWLRLPPDARARLLLAVAESVSGNEMTAGKRHVHIAKFALPAAAFGAHRACAPEFCAAVAGLFHSVGRTSDQEKVAAFDRYFRPRRVGMALTDGALTDVAEALDLAGYIGPEFARRFLEWTRVLNEGTDSPNWGRSFEALRAEAEGPSPTVVYPGDAWSDAAIGFLSPLPEVDRAAWLALLRHCGRAGANPGPSWTRRAAALIDTLGPPFAPVVSDWFRLVGRPGTRRRSLHGWPPDATYLLEPNNPTLRGLLFAAALRPTAELAAAAGDVAVACDQRVLRLGPRCALIRNAALKSLSRFPTSMGAAQIARLDQVLRYKSARRIGGNVLREAARRADLSPESFVERNVPHYGLADGVARRRIGDATVEVRVDGPRVVVSWQEGDGSRSGLPSEATKREHPEEVKRVATLAREMTSVLGAHTLRLERLTASGRMWPMTEWRAAYHEHPLLASVARRLIWRLHRADAVRSIVWDGSTWIDSRGKALGQIPDQAHVSTWHPSTAAPDEVLALRVLLEELGVRQPFKQAHREIYLLTPAERRAGRSSVRFASHVLRARPFAALLRQRGWEGNPVTTFDGAYSAASLRLPASGLTAEFNTEPLNDDMDGATFRHVVTGSLRFSRPAEAESRSAEVVPLGDVPAVVFSEVMRDLDLFVSVCSVGTDPLWEARAEGRVAEYWREYAFGELTPSAVTRREVIARLIRRIDTLRDTASVEGRFLHVRGRVRSYRIHLGSGNAVMEPGDQHLCIVPGASEAPMGVRATGTGTGLFLPFEGDAMLSVILSKALMLAEDDKIKDPSITRQIGR